MPDDAASLRVAISVGFFLLLAGLESVRPGLTLIGDLGARWISNLSLYAANIGLAVALGAIGLGSLNQLAADHGPGLFALLVGPGIGWVPLLAGLLVLDLYNYATHRLLHEAGLLWILHGVHHGDVDLDVTTAFRHHPGETLLMVALGAVFSFAIGLPAEIWALYTLLNGAAAMIQHANLCLPEALDRALRTVFVTPGMHRSHHAAVRAIHDSNYGALLSVWDRLFGTYYASSETERRALSIGLEGFQAATAQRLPAVLRMPMELARSGRTVAYNG